MLMMLCDGSSKAFVPIPVPDAVTVTDCPTIALLKAAAAAELNAALALVALVAVEPTPLTVKLITPPATLAFIQIVFAPLPKVIAFVADVPVYLLLIALAIAFYMLKGLNYRQIAEKMGKSPKAIDNAIQRMKGKAEG